MTPRTKAIGLLDHMGGGNLGDDATQTAVIQNIRTRWPQAELFGFSMNPDDTRKRHGITSYPIRRRTWSLGAAAAGNGEMTFKARLKAAISKHRRVFRLIQAINAVAVRMPRSFVEECLFLRKSFRVLLSFDLLIVNGGGQLTDAWGGAWAFPYTVFKWTCLARLAGVRCIVLNVGAGPLKRPLSKCFVRRALRLSEYTSFRDEGSRTLVQDIGFSGRADVAPDSVYSLPIPASCACPAGKGNHSIVGISPMAYGNTQVYPEHDPAVYDGYIRSLALFASWLVDTDYALTLFCSDIGVDPPAIDDLQTALKGLSGMADSGLVSRPSVASTSELLASMAPADYIVTARFHGVVFAHLLNKPVIAISHHPKITRLMNDLGLSEYCLDIKRCDISSLKNRFLLLERNRETVVRRMAESLARYRNELTKQFDVIFSAAVR
jgi:polysaccharide pyruvyl transferase WcaK-like protein